MVHSDVERLKYPILASREKCTGCGACSITCPNHCLTLVSDKYGFKYPELTNKQECIGCKSCEKVCPVLLQYKKEINNPITFAAYSKNDMIRSKSSSGGIVSEIAEYVIQKNGYVYGAVFDEDYSVKHICIDKIEELEKIRGAKYSQSNLDKIFIDVKNKLSNDKTVLFIGTPCQIAGLKSYLRVDYKKLS